jgi:hypothetical protein
MSLLTKRDAVERILDLTSRSHPDGCGNESRWGVFTDLGPTVILANEGLEILDQLQASLNSQGDEARRVVRAVYESACCNAPLDRQHWTDLEWVVYKWNNADPDMEIARGGDRNAAWINAASKVKAEYDALQEVRKAFEEFKTKSATLLTADTLKNMERAMAGMIPIRGIVWSQVEAADALCGGVPVASVFTEMATPQQTNTIGN